MNYAQLMHQGCPPGKPMSNGGKGGTKINIDTRPLADASMYASQISDQLGREQIAEAKRQYDLNMDVARPIVDAQTGLMNQAIVQGNDYYDYNKSTFRPIEQSLANDAMYGTDPYTDMVVPEYRSTQRQVAKTVYDTNGTVDTSAIDARLAALADVEVPQAKKSGKYVTNQKEIDAAKAKNTELAAQRESLMRDRDALLKTKISTPRTIYETVTDDNSAAIAAAQAQNARNQSVKANIEAEASRAGADVQRGLANMQSQNARAMRSMGVNPNSGRFAAMKVGEGLQGAAMKAAAQTNSRQKGVQLDYAKRLDSAGLARGLSGASQGAYGVALNSGNSAVANQMQPSGQLLSGMQAGAGTINQGNQTMVQGLGTALNAQTQAAIASAQNSGGSDGLGSLIGAGLGMWAGMR